MIPSSKPNWLIIRFIQLSQSIFYLQKAPVATSGSQYDFGGLSVSDSPQNTLLDGNPDGGSVVNNKKQLKFLVFKLSSKLSFIFDNLVKRWFYSVGYKIRWNGDNCVSGAHNPATNDYTSPDHISCAVKPSIENIIEFREN